MRLSSRLTAAASELWVSLFAWIPTPVGIALRQLCWTPFFAHCGKKVRFGTGLFFAGMANMHISSGVRLGRHCVLTAQDGRLELGPDVALSPNVHVAADSGTITIGAKTAIGPGTVIRAANHCTERIDIPIMSQGHVRGEIHIDEDVWIGANCTLTPDISIGKGAIVGAGAVVTHDVAPLAIVAGVPAKVIGWRGQSQGEEVCR